MIFTEAINIDILVAIIKLHKSPSMALLSIIKLQNKELVGIADNCKGPGYNHIIKDSMPLYRAVWSEYIKSLFS